MPSHPVLLSACVASAAAVICCICVCFTVGVIAVVALRGSESDDRPKIIKSLSTVLGHFLRPWWRRE